MLFEEFAAKFDDLYGQDYEYEIDETEACIFLGAKTKQCILFEGVRIDYEGDRFSIYTEFLYEDCYSKIQSYIQNKRELFFREALNQQTSDEVETSIEDGMGCPFSADQVGFFHVPFSWEELASKIEMFEFAFANMPNISDKDIDKSSCEYSILQETAQELYAEIKELAPELCTTPIKDTALNKDNQLDTVLAYVNDRKTTVIGIGKESLECFCPDKKESSCQVYSGIKYFIASDAEDPSQTLVLDKRRVDEVLQLFEEVNGDWGVDLSTIFFSIGGHNKLILSFCDLWAIVLPLNEDMYETYFTFEKNALRKLEHDYRQIAPKDIWSREYDFSILSDEQFEAMCRDILQSIGFKDVVIRGKTHAPDGGVDITAKEEFKSLIGDEKRKWIFQCKHTKSQVNRRDISEARDLLTEFNADCYGLFYSGVFSPATLDRVETIQNKDKITIKVWDYNDLEVMLSQHARVSLKYFGL